MHILMFSINPLFPNAVMGGAPKHLQNIAVHLGEMGHDITVLCAEATDPQGVFHWHERVVVKPILRFKQPFPQPYAVPAHQLAMIVQDVADHLQVADRFYMHDGEFLFPYVYTAVPTIVSLRDNVYPETLLGGFLFQGTKLVLISEHSRQYYKHTVGRFFPDFENRVVVIPNGLDWSRFQPTAPRRILDYVPVDPAIHDVVLHPHRPEPSKGIMQTIQVADQLVHQYGLRQLRVVAPRWHHQQASPDMQAFYDDIEAEISQRGLGSNFLLHDWIPQELMPEYYSMGRVTLALGFFQESFGNAVYESLGCGTPSIAARVTTHRELLPDSLMYKVDFGDVDHAAELAARVIMGREEVAAETTMYLRSHYGVEQQLAAYADVILTADLQSPMQYQPFTVKAATRYVLAPWCYVAGHGVYHDYLATYEKMDDIVSLCNRHPHGFNLDEAEVAQVPAERVYRLYRDGYLVPASYESTGN